MSRQRFIYPEIWRSEQFLALSVEARLLFVGIFSTADDYGRHKASGVSLKVEVFPVDSFTPEQVCEWRDEIAEQGMIRLYRDDEGAEILDVPSWEKFQNPRHKSESRLAAFPGAGAIPQSAGETPSCAGETPSTPGEPPADDGSGVVWCGVEKSGVEKSGIQARRRRTAHGVPSFADASTSTPDGVSESDWRRIIALTAEWPYTGMCKGLKRLADIMRGGGPDDAERWVLKADRGWREGKLDLGPWAVVDRGWEPPDAKARASPREAGEVESIRDVLPPVEEALQRGELDNGGG